MPGPEHVRMCLWVFTCCGNGGDGKATPHFLGLLGEFAGFGSELWDCDLCVCVWDWDWGLRLGSKTRRGLGRGFERG